MAMVYFYIPVDKLEDVLDCGLKLSEWKNRHQATPWNNGDKPCLSTCLHPHDDPRVKNPGFQCIKLDIPAEDCVVADRDLYRLSLEYTEIKKDYWNTMVPLGNYLFGSFRKPECLVFTTILPEQLRRFGKGLDEPILYESSEALYVNNILERYHDRYSEINQTLLYSFLALQEQQDLIQVFRSEGEQLAVFFDREKDCHITVPIPDLAKYPFEFNLLTPRGYSTGSRG